MGSVATPLPALSRTSWGSRIAELQVRVLWEELLERYSNVEVVGPPVRTRSSFVNGFPELPVQLHER